MAAQSSTGIRIAVSACLLGEPVRYDGADKRHPLILQLARTFELRPFCPEVAIGLGVPRAPVQLVKTAAGIRARGVDNPAHDVTCRLQAHARAQCEALRDCAALIFKSRSPSCGLGSTPLFDEQGKETGQTRGLFAAVLQDCLPGVLMVEDRDLADAHALRDFVARLTGGRDSVF